MSGLFWMTVIPFAVGVFTGAGIMLALVMSYLSLRSKR